MKRIVLSLLLLTLLKINLRAQYPDLPGSGSFNPQTLPTGSYVIAMDNFNQNDGSAVNENQNINMVNGSTTATLTAANQHLYIGMTVSATGIPAGTRLLAISGTTITLSNAATTTANNRGASFGGFRFNLRAYGLLVMLLNNNIKLKWVVNPGKQKDDYDFSVNASRIKPSAGVASDLNFAAGPFVISAADTAGVAALVQTFNGTASNDDVKLYKTNAAVTVDVRYDYFFNGSVWKPKVAILDDGGNSGIHESYLQNAGVPTANYSIEPTAAFITNCYTFASEPHNTSADPAVIQGIRSFVENGSNFLAECAAVRTYELSTLARFQSANGFDNANENGDPDTWTYSNADLAYFQFNGYFGIADEGGSLKDWVIPEAPGNSPVNHFHAYTSGADNGRNYTNASVSKLRPTNEKGGLVFYLGSHSYDGNQDFDINGQRLYLNAMMVPTQTSLKVAAAVTCGNTVTVNCGSSDGPSFAYPLNFTLYRDLAPSGYNAGDPQLGNVVTMTAPNVYQGGISQITAAAPPGSPAYVVVITPAGGCKPNDVQTACGVLAVGFSSFTAKRNGPVAELKWTTSSEQNNRGFQVERMAGTGNWQTAGFVHSLAPGGNSSSALNYVFNDPNNIKTVSQYRIRQVDIDGGNKLSEIRVVPGLDQKDKVILYPNPASDGKINVVFDGVAVRDLSVIDMNGRMIKQMNGITNNHVQVDQLPPGMYTLKITVPATGVRTIEKFVILK